MRNQKGFSLIELMIVVAIIGIIAGIAIPALLRARIAANESSAKADLKATTSSTVTYANGNNGAFPSTLECMGAPTVCAPGSLGQWPGGTSPFLDSLTGCLAGTPGVNTPVQYLKSGYLRNHNSGTVSTAGTFDFGLTTWSMIANPSLYGNTGVNYFGTDQSGLVCFDPAVQLVFTPAGLTQPCNPIGG